jgi:hypothetical protein
LRLAFGFTTLHPADDERGRFAICRTTGCLSHVRTCHFLTRDAGRHVLDVWQRLLAVAENCAFTDCPHCGWPSASRLFIPPMTSADASLSARRQTAYYMYAPATLAAYDVGWHALDAWQRFLVVAEGCAFTDSSHRGWSSTARLFLSADDERGRLAICRMTGGLSSDAPDILAVCDAGRHALEVWQRLLVLKRAGAFIDWPHCDCPSTARLFIQPMTSADASPSAGR